MAQNEFKWIDCSRRKPKNSVDDYCLAQIQEINGYQWIPRVMEYREQLDDWRDDELGFLKSHGGSFVVTHWAKLPEHPKKKILRKL